MIFLFASYQRQLAEEHTLRKCRTIQRYKIILIISRIKKAIPPTESAPVFAVKFIHKAYAVKHGRISAKQIAMEVSLHSHIGQHPNIIEWFATGEDAVWKWIAMEYAEGGDLFDKIEADVGVSEDIAHFYFSQLISGVSFIHSKGVGHRDIKPENILLSDSGNLKLADFGLATLFEYNGSRKLSTTMCGSPPYIAPEVISCAGRARHAPKGTGYSADLVDIWSCGVVLFVLLVGNTPWDEPTTNSWEYSEYVDSKGLSSDALWQNLPSSTLSLLRGMLAIDPSKRFSFEKIRRHPWFTRKNPLLTSDGRLFDPLHLATQMLQNLRIDFSQQPTASQRPSRSQDAMAMDIDNNTPFRSNFSATQPETPMSDAFFNWERPPPISLLHASQPVSGHNSPAMHMLPPSSLADEPSMSQFSAMPTVPVSLTQHARKFRDIVPAYSLTRFFSHVSTPLLVSLLSSALHTLNVPVPSNPLQQHRGLVAWFKVKMLDGRGCGLTGEILIEQYTGGGETDLLEIRFVKVKGDPLEWRRFFKKVVVLAKDGVYVPEN
jgi:serine/threonine-protein kinase Chk1